MTYFIALYIYIFFVTGWCKALIILGSILTCCCCCCCFGCCCNWYVFENVIQIDCLTNLVTSGVAGNTSQSIPMRTSQTSGKTWTTTNQSQLNLEMQLRETIGRQHQSRLQWQVLDKRCRLKGLDSLQEEQVRHSILMVNGSNKSNVRLS